MARGRKTKVVVPAPSLADQSGRASQRKSIPVSKPSDLTAAAAAKWDVIVPLVAAVCDLRESDQDALRQYCEAVVLRAKAVRELELQPLVVSSPNGALQINPLQKIIANQDTLLMKLSERFGLDPASRQRLKIVAEKTESPFLDFLKNGRNRRKPEAEAPDK